MGSRQEVLWSIADEAEPLINNLRLENAEDFPFLLSTLVEKNFKTLNLMCGMVPDGSFVFSGSKELLKLPLTLKDIFLL